jgi:hypothetical protein
MLSLNFLHNLLHQLASLAVLLGLAFVSREITSMLLPAGFTRFILSGMLYSLLVALCLLAAPRLAGCSRQELYSIGERVWHNLPWQR